MTEPSEIPEKPYYKVGEVCKYTDTQPYVLRFWESEFPQLVARKDRAGQRVYSRDDLDVVLRIKKLLYDQEYTIADARRALEGEWAGSAARSVSPAILDPNAGVEAALEPEPEPQGAEASPRTAARDSYRASYEAARQEITRLRALLAEAEERTQVAEQELEGARESARTVKARAERVAERLEALLESMSAASKSNAST